MISLLRRFDMAPCRCCGAIEGAPDVEGESVKSLCLICARQYRRWLRTGKQRHSHNQMNGWLARKLYLAAQRLKSHEVTGRCEAITLGAGKLFVGQHGPQGGYQCGREASMLRDGRPVCSSHGRIAHSVQFIEDRSTTMYADMARLFAELALVDEDFFTTIKEAIESVTKLKHLSTDGPSTGETK